MPQTYYPSEQNIGKASDLPVTINFSALTGVPATFNTTPFVSAGSALVKDGGGNVVAGQHIYVSAKTTTTVTLDFVGGYIGSPDYDIYADLIIRGTPSTIIAEVEIADLASDFHYIIGDKNRKKFNESRITRLFNNAQDRAIRLLLPQNLDQLHFEHTGDSAITLTATSTTSISYFDLLDLDYRLWNRHNGIKDLRIKVSSTSGQQPYLDVITWNEYREIINKPQREYSDERKPLCVIRDNLAYIMAIDSDDEIEGFFMREPTSIVVASFTDNTLNTNCEFDREFQDVMLGLSFDKYRFIKKEAETAYDDALDKAKEINKAARTSHGILFARDYSNKNIVSNIRTGQSIYNA